MPSLRFRPDLDDLLLIISLVGHAHQTCYNATNHWSALTDGKLKYIFNACPTCEPRERNAFRETMRENLAASPGIQLGCKCRIQLGCGIQLGCSGIQLGCSGIQLGCKCRIQLECRIQLAAASNLAANAASNLDAVIRTP